MDLTLTAFYKEKPNDFFEYIRWCQSLVFKQIAEAFRPYDPAQVHATIVGLEGIRKNHKVYNTCYGRLGKIKEMDLEGLLDCLGDTTLPPLQIRLGGFRFDHNFSFTSLGQHPYQRSFAIQHSGIVVAMGWPAQKLGEFPATLDCLRRSFNQYNILHKYHKTEKDVDNDFFFVLGKIDPEAISKGMCERVSEGVREEIAAIEPIYIDITHENLSLVAYENEELPLSTSIQFSLKDARNDIAALKALYTSETIE